MAVPIRLRLIGLSTRESVQSTMKKTLLNISTIQDGSKIQLIKAVRMEWGEERTRPGKRVAYYKTEDGAIIIEPLD